MRPKEHLLPAAIFLAASPAVMGLLAGLVVIPLIWLFCPAAIRVVSLGLLWIIGGMTAVSIPWAAFAFLRERSRIE